MKHIGLTLLSLSFLLITGTTLWGQNTKTQNQKIEFAEGRPYSLTALSTYQYYINASGQEVKQGQQQIKGNKKKTEQVNGYNENGQIVKVSLNIDWSVEGSVRFEQGLPDGDFMFELSENLSQPMQTSISYQKVTGAFDKGTPTGTWHYNYSVTNDPLNGSETQIAGAIEWENGWVKTLIMNTDMMQFMPTFSATLSNGDGSQWIIDNGVVTNYFINGTVEQPGYYKATQTEQQIANNWKRIPIEQRDTLQYINLGYIFTTMQFAMDQPIDFYSGTHIQQALDYFGIQIPNVRYYINYYMLSKSRIATLNDIQTALGNGLDIAAIEHDHFFTLNNITYLAPQQVIDQYKQQVLQYEANLHGQAAAQGQTFLNQLVNMYPPQQRQITGQSNVAKISSYQINDNQVKKRGNTYVATVSCILSTDYDQALGKAHYNTTFEIDAQGNLQKGSFSKFNLIGCDRDALQKEFNDFITQSGSTLASRPVPMSNELQKAYNEQTANLTFDPNTPLSINQQRLNKRKEIFATVQSIFANEERTQQLIDSINALNTSATSRIIKEFDKKHKNLLKERVTTFEQIKTKSDLIVQQAANYHRFLTLRARIDEVHQQITKVDDKKKSSAIKEYKSYYSAFHKGTSDNIESNISIAQALRDRQQAYLQYFDLIDVSSEKSMLILNSEDKTTASVIKAFSKYYDNFEFVMTSNTQQGLNSINRLLALQDSTLSFIELRKELAKGENDIHAFKKQSKQLVNLYDDVVSNYDTEWNAIDPPCRLLRQIIATQELVIRVLSNGNSNEIFKQIKKQKINTLEALYNALL